MQAPRISHEDESMAERWYCTVNHRSRSAVISDAPLYSTSAWAITTVLLLRSLPRSSPRSGVFTALRRDVPSNPPCANDVPVEVVNLTRSNARQRRGNPKESGKTQTRFHRPHQNGHPAHDEARSRHGSATRITGGAARGAAPHASTA